MGCMCRSDRRSEENIHPRSTKQARSAGEEVDCLLLPGVREGMTALGSCLGAWVGFGTSAEVENVQEKDRYLSCL